MKNRDICWWGYKIQETLYMGQWCLSPLESRYLGTSHSSPNCHQLPHCIFLNLINGLKSQGWFQFWEKPEVPGHQIWVVGGLSHLGNLMFHQKALHKTWDHEWAHCHDEAANHQLPIPVAFWIIQIVSTEECSRLMQNVMQILCSACSVFLNVMAPQYTCSLSGIYHPQWLMQWSCHCSCVCIPVHSPWLPGYIDVMQTVFIILTMAGLLQDRPGILPFFSTLEALTFLTWPSAGSPGPFPLPKQMTFPRLALSVTSVQSLFLFMNTNIPS